ncbi:hypothetical protein C8J56DRAFT_910372 [Mycena floridula]|nr:hypothetical protein C8J56DRAFT_910372 [Mycena floridula]
MSSPSLETSTAELTLTTPKSQILSFPSPGSGFVGPKAPEFVVRIPGRKNSRGLASPGVSPVAATDPPLSVPSEPEEPPLAVTTKSEPSITPTKSTYPNNISPAPTPQSRTPTTPSFANLSFSSSRPAPPSPAVSRRASKISSSRRASKVSSSSRRSSLSREHKRLSRGNSTKRGKRISSSTKPSFGEGSMGPPAIAFTIKIRDFGFDDADDKHRGLGPDVPRANEVARLNRALNRHVARLSTASSVHSHVEEEDQDDMDLDDSFGFGRLSWSFAVRNQVPKEDLERNFDSPVDDDEEQDEGFEDEEYQDAEEYEDEEKELVPGLYRALFAFEPEGTSEMRLVEKQEVTVVGRGGGIGWAVVVDGTTGDDQTPRHALVPESYIVLVKADSDSEPA